MTSLPHEPVAAKSRRAADMTCVALLVALAAALWAPRLRGVMDLRYDAGVYYVLGTSLADGNGYRLVNEPGNITAVQYPPLLPAFVAAHVKLAGTDDPAVIGRWLRVSYFGLFLMYVLAVYVMARQFLPPLFALFVGATSSIHHQIVFLSDLLFAELPFALTATAFIAVHTYARRRAESPFPPTKPAAAGLFTATALLGAATFLLRSAGLALLLAWVAESILRRQWRVTALRAVVALIPVIAWQAFVSRTTAGPEFREPAYAYQRDPYMYYNVTYGQNMALTDPFHPELGHAGAGDLARRVRDNLLIMPLSVGEAVSARNQFWAWVIKKACGAVGAPSLADPLRVAVPTVVAMLGFVVLAGAGAMAWRRQWLVPLYVAASVALICSTPWPQQFARYLAPVTPVLSLCCGVGLWVAWQWARRCRRERESPQTSGRLALLEPAAARGALIAVATIACAVAATQLFATWILFKSRFEPSFVATADDGSGARVGQRLFFYERRWADVDAALAWIKAHAEPDAVLATSAPHWAYLKTGRRSVMTPMEADPARALSLLDSVPVDYLIVDEMDFLDISARYMKPMVDSHEEMWEKVFGAKDAATAIYRRTSATRQSPATAPSGGTSNVTP